MLKPELHSLLKAPLEEFTDGRYGWSVRELPWCPPERVPAPIGEAAEDWLLANSERFRLASEEDVGKALSLLIAGGKRSTNEQAESDPKLRVSAYMIGLGVMPVRFLDAAVNRLLGDRTRRFLPDAGELRELCIEAGGEEARQLERIHAIARAQRYHDTEAPREPLEPVGSTDGRPPPTPPTEDQLASAHAAVEKIQALCDKVVQDLVRPRRSSGPDYADAAVRKQQWESRVIEHLRATRSTGEFAEILSAYMSGDVGAKRAFEAASRELAEQK